MEHQRLAADPLELDVLTLLAEIFAIAEGQQVVDDGRIGEQLSERMTDQ